MMNRMTSLAALLAAGMVLAACQDEEAEATETGSEVESVETTAEEAGNNVEAAAEETGDMAEDTADAAAEETGDMAEDTADAGAEANDNEAEQVEVETSDTGAASAEATDDALEAARDGESPAQAAQDDAIEAAEEEGTVGAEAGGSDSADMSSSGRQMVEDALTVEGFDPEVLTTAIENAELNDMVRTALTNAVQNVDPENEVAVEALANRLRIAFGMN